MLAKIDTQQLDLRPAGEKPDDSTGHDSDSIIAADFLHDGFPYFYLTAGFAAIYATLYIADWFWLLPHSVLVAGGLCHAVIFSLRRRGEAPSPHQAESVSPH